MADLISQNFIFSQSNLHTFTYCRRRFYLRYIQKLIWPAQLVSDQQYSQDRDAGVRFHRIVHQHFLGFEAALLKKVAESDPDPRVSSWFNAFLSNPVSQLGGKLTPEALYNTEIAGHTLSAKVDLLQIEAGKITIFDWKTSRQLPKASSLQKHAQSKVYPLVISRVFNQQMEENGLDSLSMVYWEANYPDETIEILSSQADWHKYEREITSLIELIVSLQKEEFVSTPDVRKCDWCEYRSYCQRGKAAQNSEDIQGYDLIDDEVENPWEASDSWRTG